MSEKINFSYENEPTPEIYGEKHKKKAHETLKEAHEAKESSPSKEELSELLKSAQEKAKSAETTSKALDGSQNTKGTVHLISKDLRSNSLKQVLKRTQKRLPFDQRALSKFVHKPVVDSVSEFSSKTVARPSGIAMGGAFSLLSSLFILWASYFFGYTYNFLIGIMAFVGGFVAGVLIEFVLKVIFHRKSAL